MRQAITIARKHGETAFRMVLGPDVGIDKHKARVKALKITGESPDIAEVQIWLSDSGRFSKVDLRKPATKPATQPPKEDAHPAK